MSNSNLYEQRVVYAALKRMTKDRNVIKSAYDYWDSNLSDNQLDVFEVVGELNKYLGLEDSERKALMVAMHAASNKLADQLRPVPEYISSGAVTTAQNESDSSAPEKSSKVVSPHKAVTERYLQVVCQHVKLGHRDSFRELVTIVGDEGLPKLHKTVNKIVKDWGNSGLNKIGFADNVEESVCQDMALEFYVLLSEIIGPVESDVIVNKAIAEVINMPEAQQFNPRSLL